MNETILTRLAARITNTPIMMHPDKLNAILGVLGGRIGLSVPEGAQAAEWSPSDGRNAAADESRIAVIPVFDSLVYRTNGLTGLSGFMSYERIRARFREALADPSVAAILFDIDSPGGEVAGLFDLVDEIYGARGEKPIHAIANESAYSAAYAIASAAERVYLPRTGGMGSIGVIAIHVDQSGYDEKAGLAYTAIYAGAHKNDFSPHQPLSDDAMAGVQAEVNEIYNLFVETVARNMDLPATEVAATEAAIFQGAHAVDAGLAHAVMSWDEVIADISANIGNTDTGGFAMERTEMKTQLETLLTDPSGDAEGVLADLGYVPAADLAKIREEAAAQAGEEVMKQVAGILDVCTLADMPEMAAGLIREGCTVDEARKKVLEEKASRDGGDEIRSTLSGLATGGENPLLADAEKRRERAGRPQETR